MKIIIFSDVHGNLEALQAALDIIKEYPDAKVFSLGDIVGYGANPNECLTEVRKIAHLCLAGNHDHASIGLTDISYFNPYAKKAIIWTAEQLDENGRDYILKLPLFKEDPNGIFFVHSTPLNPEKWNYILNIDDARCNFPFFKGHLCFIGHSHVPKVFEFSPEGIFSKEVKKNIQLIKENRYIINVGSIGQPRDGNWRASVLIYDEQTQTVEFRRLEYDIITAQDKIKRAGLPPILAERLRYGK